MTVTATAKASGTMAYDELLTETGSIINRLPKNAHVRAMTMISMMILYGYNTFEDMQHAGGVFGFDYKHINILLKANCDERPGHGHWYRLPTGEYLPNENPPAIYKVG